MTGLVIGSLSPDFEYFVRMKIQSDYSHGIVGLFLFNLPISILIAFVFHNIVKKSLFENAPKVIKSRIVNFLDFNWNKYFSRKWFVVIISILLGAISHVFLDSFTHQDGFFVNTISFLKKEIFIFNKQIPVYKFVQHISSFVGIFTIFVVLLKLPNKENVSGKIDLKYWSLITIIFVGVVFLRLLFGLDYKLYGHLIVSCISASLIALILTPTLLRLSKKYKI